MTELLLGAQLVTGCLLLHGQVIRHLCSIHYTFHVRKVRRIVIEDWCRR